MDSMKKLISLVVTGIILISCTQTKLSNEFLEHVHDSREKWIIKNFGILADSTFNDSTDLKSLIAFKTIDSKGSIENIEMDLAIKLYQENINNERIKLYPIFEVKNSPNVILPVYGQGLWDKIWGRVILDKKTFKITNIDFNHKNETPGIGGNINDPQFKAQFIGTSIHFSSNSYSLYQDSTKVTEGKQKIDGMSGATVTSKGVVQMLNDGLSKYEKYLR
jgi:Na+-transporting NADH:ubiquinone oxidoreductase subunit C